MYKESSVAVVVPVYNEEGFISEVLRTIPGFVDRVYVVDDRSTDGTWKEIQYYVAQRTQQPDEPEDAGCAARADGTGAQDRIVPVRKEENTGVGGAIKTGYLLALDDGIDVTAVMAGDGQMDPDILDRIIEPVVQGDADYSKGNRLRNREYRESMSQWRLFGNSLLTFLTKISSGYWKTMDPQNGYTAISKGALKALEVEELYDDYGFANDLLVHLNVHNMVVADVPMPALYGEENSHINYTSFIPGLSWVLLKDLFWRLKTKYLVLDFNPLALFYLSGTVISILGTLGIGWSAYKKVAENSPIFVPGTMSLLVFMLGSMLLLFAMLFDMQTNKHLEITGYH